MRIASGAGPSLVERAIDPERGSRGGEERLILGDLKERGYPAPTSHRTRANRQATPCRSAYLVLGWKCWFVNGKVVGVWMRMKETPPAVWQVLQAVVRSENAD